MTSAVPSTADVLETVDALGPPGTPVTTPEVAEGFDCTQRTIYNRLEALVEEGPLLTKKVGANSRVWWRPVDGDVRRNGGASDERGPVSLRDRQAHSFTADGEMAERIREFEWATTPIGPIDEWPPALRVAVDIMLGADEAIGIYWGDDLTLLYNDLAADVIGKKHPDALGQPARDVFPEAWDTLGPVHEQVMGGGGATRLENLLLPLERTDEIEDIWWNTSYNPIPLADGSVGGVFNVAVDVTERKEAERKLRETKERLEVALTAAGMGTWEWDLEARTVDGDETMLSLFDLPPSDEPVPVEEFLVKESETGVEQAEDTMVSAFEPGEEIQDEFELEGVDPPRWLSWRGRASADDPTVLRGVSFEITERKLAEIERERALEELRESEERYHTLFDSLNESIQEGFCIVELLEESEVAHEASNRDDTVADRSEPGDYRFVETNPAFEELTGLTDVVGARRSDLDVDGDFPGFDVCAEVARTGESWRVETTGEPLVDGWFDVRVFPYGGSDSLQVAVLIDDITERKRQERELERQAELDAFRVALTDAIRPLSDPMEIQREAAHTIGQHLDVSRAHYAHVRLEDGVSIVDADYYRDGVPSVVGEHRFDDYGPWMLDSLKAGETIVVDDIEADPAFDEENQETLDQVDIRSLVVAPLHRDGRLTGFFTVDQRAPREWTEVEVEMVEETAQRTWEAVERARAEQEVREGEAELAAELAATRKLQEISTELIQEDDIESLSDRILAAAVEIMDSDFASVQLYDPDRDDLELVANRGFTPEAVAAWQRVSPEHDTTCGRALATGERVIASDVETTEFIAETEELENYRQTGIRAMQTTPLVSRNGDVLGMFSTHWETPHDLSERDLGHLDILARQAADLIENRQTTESLRESEERYRTLFESIDEGFCIIEVLFDGDDDPVDYRFLETNPAFEGQTGLIDAEGERMRDLEPNHEEHWFETYGRIARTGEPERFQNEAQYLGDRWYDVYAFRIGDPEERKVAILFNDISELRHTQQALERLTVASRELLDAEMETIHGRVAALTVDVLDVEYAALWRYDEASGDLAEATSALNTGSEANAVHHPDDVAEHVWQAFVGDEQAVSNDLPVDETAPDGATLRSRLLIPLGRHGVVCVGSLQTNVFDERVVDLAETLGATLETAWDRAEGEHRLQAQNEELQRLDRLNTLIREIDQALVGAASREEIDEAICERLAGSDLYGSAWLATYDVETDSLRPQAWAGIDSRYLDDRTVTVGDAPSDDPLVAAHRTNEMQVVPDIATDARAASWREDALEHGIRSCLSVPLVYEGAAYGILTVHGRTPRPDEREREVLAEFGQTIAHAIHALEATTTRRSDSVVELTFRTREANTPLARLARETGCDITVEGIVPSATDDELLVFFTATNSAPGDLSTASDGILAIEDLVCLDEREDGSLFRVRLTDPQFVSVLVSQDAAVRSVIIEAGTVTVVADLPQTGVVSEFLDELRQLLPDLELLARTTRTRPLETQSSLRMTVEDRLTPRQLEVLQTAYESGYFESPRVQTGKDLSEVLDISQSTFTYHLRESQRRLCELVFEPA